MKIVFSNQEIDLDKALDGSTDRKSPKDILGGIIFSMVISLIPASIAAVLLINQNQESSVSDVASIFFITLALSTVLLFMIRFFVRGFARTFSIIFLSIFALVYIFVIVHNLISASACIHHNGHWKRIYPNERRSGLVNKCVISKSNLLQISPTSIIYSSLNTIEIME